MSGQEAPPGAEAPDGMAWIPGGAFLMGDDGGLPDERPQHEVFVSGFWMDRQEVTNDQFLEFVLATGHVTTSLIFWYVPFYFFKLSCYIIPENHQHHKY